MQKIVRKAALCSATCLTAIVTLSAIATPALAQDTDQTATADDSAPASPIIVTGSRIARPEAETPNPVVTVTAQQFQQSGTTNLTDYLTKIPALSGSTTSYDSSGDRAGIGGTGLNLLNLRNLGTDRTLVLIDGRRQVASVDGTQAVDINTIPEDLIERVEVLTGGASAIYGADGVSGVVNFVQKKDFEGLTGRIQGGISSHGDAGQRLIALTAGHNFADGRGNIALAWEHSEEDRLQQSQRSRYSGENKVGFYLNSADTETGGENNDGIPDYIPLKNIRYNDTSREGGIDVDFDGIPDFYGSQGLPYDSGTFVPNYYQQGGSGTLISDYGNDLRPEIHRDLFNALAHFDVSPALTIYAEGKYARTHSYTLGQPSWDYYLYIPEDNPYIPDAVRPYIDPENGGVLLNRDDFDLGQRGESITRQTFRSVLGAKGEIAKNLNYDISWVYGQTKVKNRYINNILSDRFYAAIDAVSDGNGGVTCRANLDPSWTPDQPYAYVRSVLSPTTFAAGDGSCSPLDLFGQNIASNQKAIDWITADTVDRTKLTQNVVSGSITGNSGAYFNLPGGPLAFALGGEYRRETSSFTPDPLAAEGLTFSNSLGSTSGKFNVWELFGELDAPILKDTPFAYRLNLDAAYRYSHYSTTGANSTWKVGGSWAPVRDITFRGTYSTAVRAPNISELYGASSQTYEFIDDPCGQDYLQNGTQYRVDNCKTLLTSLGANPATYNDLRSSNIPGYSGGNPDIKQEKAKTWTAGFVLQPRFVPGLMISADWYDIKITNAINTVDPQTVANLCVDQPTLDNQYCAAITRENGGTNPGYITSFVVSPLNVANFRTNGLDLTIDYQLRTAKAGTFGIRATGSYLHRLTYIPIPGAVEVDDNVQPGAPKYQVVTDLSWQGKAVSFNWRINYASAVNRFDNQTIESNPDIVAPEYLKYKRLFSHDIYAAVEINDQFQIYAGVNNLFNQKPSIGALDTPIDAVGRYFFVGAKMKLADIFGGAS